MDGSRPKQRRHPYRHQALPRSWPPPQISLWYRCPQVWLRRLTALLYPSLQPRPPGSQADSERQEVCSKTHPLCVYHLVPACPLGAWQAALCAPERTAIRHHLEINEMRVTANPRGFRSFLRSNVFWVPLVFLCFPLMTSDTRGKAG